MRKRYNKGLIQKSVDDIIEMGQYNEEYGRQVLAITDASAKRRGLYYRYTQYDVDYIIKPKMVQDLLVKIFKYEKDKGSAYSYMVGIMTTAIIDAERKILSAGRAESIHPKTDEENVEYIDQQTHIINNDL